MTFRNCLPFSSLLRLLAAGLSVMLFTGPATSRSLEEQKADRAAVAKCITATGTIIRREAPDRPWMIVKEGEVLHSGDLLIGLPGAEIESSNGAVRVTFRSDLGGVTPFPIVETAIVLFESKDMDLDFRLDRGRIEFSSRKAKGRARVRPRIREVEDAKGEVDLDPRASCALEIYGRWHAGVPFTRELKPGQGPTLHVIFLVLKGEIALKLGTTLVAMKAPPGPALIEWDSQTGGDPTPRRLDALPKWATDDDRSEAALKKKALLDQFRKRALEKSIDAAVDDFLKSDDLVRRDMAVDILGALDDLKRLGDAMLSTKQADVWDNGVLALRHWIGRGPGQDQKLYQGLIREAKLKPVEAEAILQLLHSFGEADLARPETYEMLIDYLAHDQLAIRGLANWHLVRLVPEGRKLGFDPMADKEARSKAIDQWRKLVPHGKLPPKPDPKKP